MTRRRTNCLLLSCLLFATPSLRAQHTNVTKHGDTKTSLADAFLNGKITGRFRYFFMSTINQGALSDHFANAVGGYLKYTTAPLHNFQLAVGSSFTYNIWSSDLNAPDPITGNRSRYEIALFDVNDPANKRDMVRLDELHLRYRLGKSANRGVGTFTLGKQFLNTPFLNEQDGRMRPSSFDGLWIDYQKNRTGLEGGWIWGTSPRGTPRWYSIASSFGVYGQGTNADGSKGDYHNNTSTNGIAVLGFKYNGNAVSIKVWDHYVDNILNAAFLEAGYKVKLAKAKSDLLLATQVIREDAVGNGGNVNPQKAYIFPGSGCWVIGGKLELKPPLRHTRNWITSLNYTRVTGNSRFVMPREWGKEPFFTFILRERNEGNGNMHSFSFNFGHDLLYKQCKGRFFANMALGYTKLADVNDHRNNKYGGLSYGHLVARTTYSLNRALDGLKLEVLYVYKKNYGNDYGNLKYVINRVNMSQVNLVVNYNF